MRYVSIPPVAYLLHDYLPQPNDLVLTLTYILKSVTMRASAGQMISMAMPKF